MADDSVFIDVDYKNRKIYFSGNVEKESAQKIIFALKKMERESDKDIDMYINSYGGYVDDFMAIYDVIHSIYPKVNTFGVGCCASAGANLLLSGSGVRTAYSHCRIMLHELRRGSGWGALTDEDIRHEESKRLQTVIDEIVAKHTGKSIEQVSKDMKRDKWMDAKAAKDYGVVDRVI